VDVIENIKGSVIQHGSHNNRIYLMRWNTHDTHGLIAALDDLDYVNEYTEQIKESKKMLYEYLEKKKIKTSLG